MVGEAHDYLPERGDIVWLQFDPQLGHEQAGRRPALIVSPQSYNSKVGLALLCPNTSTVKGYPFEVEIADGLQVSGAILADQVKSLDWRARDAQFACKALASIVAEVQAKIQVLIF
jgi:mRNA interferase MazF